ncbi:MAG: DUF3109 family protein [Bacteroidia bacterium]|nr:DUF3109 family protein [Bacteroidia bacterium]
MKKNYNTVMIIEDKLVSGEVTEELFACDLSKCKGACCVQGDLGAPLEKSELKILEEIYPEVEPYLREEGKFAILDQGTSVYDTTGNYSTPLVNGRECAYVVFDKNKVALCGIENAYFDGKISFRKPVSCHLYPIRIKKTKQMEAVNYERWDVCSEACVRGAKEGIKVYEFVKDALIRKYGQNFYDELDALVKAQDSNPGK